MSQITTIALLGVGGYGRIYLTPLLDADTVLRHNVRLIATVDPNPAGCQNLGGLQSLGIPVYGSTAELYANHRPDVVIISSPIQFHAQQTIEALSHGCHVLCEKPLCATAGQARAMQQAEAASGRQVAIGYQWSFSPAIQNLKADILAGHFGAPRRCKSLTLWPRDEVYYTRNTWAGRRFTRSGQPVFDSPINNACAHFLHNLLYLLGPSMETSAQPQTVTAELYRAHPIETFDTAAVRTRVAGGVDVLMIASHATAETREPVFELQFDRATIKYCSESGGQLIARFRDGRVRDYGVPSSSASADKLWTSIEAFTNGMPVTCGIAAAMPQAIVVSAANDSTPEPTVFPPSLVRVTGVEGERRTAVTGLSSVLQECYAVWSLPSEIGASWATAGREIRLVSDVDAVRDAPPVSINVDRQAEPVLAARVAS